MARQQNSLLTMEEELVETLQGNLIIKDVIKTTVAERTQILANMRILYKGVYKQI
jgi:hypothetical protein